MVQPVLVESRLRETAVLEVERRRIQRAARGTVGRCPGTAGELKLQVLRPSSTIGCPWRGSGSESCLGPRSYGGGQSVTRRMCHCDNGPRPAATSMAVLEGDGSAGCTGKSTGRCRWDGESVATRVEDTSSTRRD